MSEPKNKQGEQMTTVNHIKYSILIIVSTALLTFGCSTNSSDGDTATINGSVEGETTQQKAKANTGTVEGAVVTAARVTSNGSIETIEGAETETDASGSFTLNVDAEAAQHIVVRAEKEGATWTGYVSGQVENGSSYTIKPVNSESSAETKVFTNLVASGHTDLVQKSDVEAVVTSRIAAEIEASSTAANRIAIGLKNAAQTRAEFYSETIESESEAALEATYEAMAEAQLQLESELEASASAESRSEAYDAFIEATVNAYTEAGLDASETAKAAEMWNRVFVNSITSVSSEVKDDARMNASLIAAAAIDFAVQEEAESSEMDESSKQAIVAAGVQLRSDIKTSAGAASEIKAAFEAYHEEVKSTMENDSSLQASLIVEIDSEINATAGPKSTFSSAISSALSASLVVDIYQTYYSEIDSTVRSKLSGMNEAHLSAVSEIMVLINLAS